MGKAEDFFRHLTSEKEASPHTVAAYRRDIGEFIRIVCDGNENFDAWRDIDTGHARNFVISLHEAGDSKRSIQRKVSSLRSFFRYLVQMQFVAENPFLNLAPIKADKPLPKVFSVNDIQRLIDAISATLILAPILVPIGVTLGINELHLGIVFCVALIIGFITPPFGINLFTVCSTAEVPFASVVKGIWPFILAAMLGVVILCLLPQICLFLPSLIG